MNADRLLAYFERISDAPDAVGRLRKFVLDLAVRGKLVEQDEKDSRPPDSLQLNDDAEPHRTEQAATHRYLTTEAERYPVPASWLWTRLGMIGEWGSGSTPSRGQAEYFGGETSWFKSGELNDNPCLTGSEERVTQLALNECSFRHNKPGDVLFAMYGATIGKLAILAEEAVTNQAVVACSPCVHVLNRYLFLFLLSQRQRFHMASEGGAQPNVSKAKVVRCPIPLPPLAEQHRIVSKVDELMKLCDRLEASQKERESRRDRLVVVSLNRLGQPTDPEEFKKDARFQLSNLSRLSTKPEHIKEFRKAILNLAVRGRLVPQDDREGTADTLLRQITAQMPPKKDSGEKKQDDVARWTIPSAWQWTQMKGLCSRVTSGATPSKDVFHESSGVPFLKVYNIRNQQIDFGYKPQFISRAYHETKMKRSTLQPGDVVMNIVGPPLGKVAIIPDNYPEWNCNQAIAVFKLVIPELAPYVYWFLRENSFLDAIELIGTAGQDNISVTKSQNIPIPLPPLAEQKRIVAKVDELMRICDQLENQLESLQKGRRQLLEALLDEALGSG